MEKITCQFVKEEENWKLIWKEYEKILKKIRENLVKFRKFLDRNLNKHVSEILEISDK